MDFGKNALESSWCALSKNRHVGCHRIFYVRPVKDLCWTCTFWHPRMKWRIPCKLWLQPMGGIPIWVFWGYYKVENMTTRYVWAILMIYSEFYRRNLIFWLIEILHQNAAIFVKEFLTVEVREIWWFDSNFEESYLSEFWW